MKGCVEVMIMANMNRREVAGRTDGLAVVGFGGVVENIIRNFSEIIAARIRSKCPALRKVSHFS